jgi:UDP-N-acetylmuramoyl-L-alanyl-D-glutamate--2,6-diaminopimelate ligase
MSLGALATQIDAVLAGDSEAMVTGVQQDSRLVGAGDLFVALSGQHSDGTRFIAQAMAAGAVAVLTKAGSEIPSNITALFVDDVRAAMADAAAEIYGRPTHSLCVVGITGTNGKTTTAQLARHALQATGARVGVVGTLGYAFEDLAIDATHTSPEADALQRIAREMLDRGAEDLIMEVSSIALAAERVRATEFDVGVFTNLTQDHLDYHATMQAYAAEKEKLFFDHAPAVSVVNIDDAHGEGLAKRLRKTRPEGQLITVSAEGKPATVRAASRTHSDKGMQISVEVDGKSHDLRSTLIGEHNAANLIMVVAIALGLGRDVAAVVEALGDAPPVAGRLERCDDVEIDDIVAVVDYAHTPDALARALMSLRSVTVGKLWCVFGCGGDRDALKRRPMGEAVAEHADVAIVTNDNPRSEDPEAIANAVAVGLGGMAHRLELDRRAAIVSAIGEAAPGDVVLVAGKGHETYQIVGDTVSDFDDREVVRAALQQRRDA